MVVPYEVPHSWEEPEGLHSLLAHIREQRSSANLAKIRFAYFFAEDAHAGQLRSTGDPYITHPLEVTRILVDLQMDDEALCAALLHDVLEDCGSVTAEKIKELFGEEVLMLVEGVTKLRFSNNTPNATARQRAAAETERSAESLRKMLLAMASDVRVMVIKLADRLHNMRTLDALPPEKRTRIANETLDIYAPLAARLGIWQIKWQLEDLAFMHLHPKEYEEIKAKIAKTREEREDEMREAILVLKERFERDGLKGFEIQGRPKHLHSVFNKIVKQDFQFEEIYDLIAIRVVLESKADCYRALGIVHDMWVPMPGLFTDYIATPKPNGYQSLHTKVLGPRGEPLEVQIRTSEMHRIAEYGIAAHWAYKDGLASSEDKLQRLRQQLFDWSSDNRMSSDFLRSVSTDLFSEQVFVFTPKGDVLDLPAGSTPVDFAFRVHSELGLNLAGSKVNGSICPLNTKLKNGDVVELITRSNAQPSLDWLEFTASSHAKSKIRAYFRKRNKGENAQRGREALERELRSQGLDPKEHLGEEKLLAIAKTFNDCETTVDLLAKLGEGLLSIQNIVSKIRGTSQQQKKPDVIQTSRSQEGKVTLVAGAIDRHVALRRAKCCDPIPGEDVVGYVSRGRGIVVHRRVCPNAMRYVTDEPERLIPLEWPGDYSSYPVTISILTVDRQGLLMDVSTILGESKANVRAANIRTLPNNTAEIDITIEVEDVKQLTSLMNKIAGYSDVISILRKFGKNAAK